MGELESLLYMKLGEYMYKRDNCFDWIDKSNISRKIEAIHILLGIDSKLIIEPEWLKEVYDVDLL